MQTFLHLVIMQDTSEMNNICYQSNKFDYNHISLKTSVCITKSLSIIQNMNKNFVFLLCIQYNK